MLTAPRYSKEICLSLDWFGLVKFSLRMESTYAPIQSRLNNLRSINCIKVLFVTDTFHLLSNIKHVDKGKIIPRKKF